MTTGEEHPPFPTTWYFDNIAPLKHPEAKRYDWVARVLVDPETREPDPRPGRTRLYGYVLEARKYLRVVLEADGAVHDAFFDGNWTRKMRRRDMP